MRQNISDWVLAFQLKDLMGKKDSKDEKGKGMWLMLIYTKEESEVWSYWFFNKIGERKLLGFNGLVS